jgi:urea carboxylase
MAKEIIEAPIVGRIIRIHSNPGDTVEEGGVICEIESMKMENPILSPVKGIVKEIKVSIGQAIRAGEIIAIIEY